MSALASDVRCAQHPPSSTILRVIDYIRAHAAHPLPVAELAALAGLSVSRFITVFRAQTGLSPHRFVCEIRVRRAQELLECGASSSRAAFEAGFVDQSHLTRHFKRICGITPAVYAKSHRRVAER